MLALYSMDRNTTPRSEQCESSIILQNRGLTNIYELCISMSYFDCQLISYSYPGNITMEYQVMVGSSYTRGSTVFSSEYTECVRRVDDFVDGDLTMLTCDEPINGQYVVIQKLDKEPLMLCEVEVYAEDGNLC